MKKGLVYLFNFYVASRKNGNDNENLRVPDRFWIDVSDVWNKIDSEQTTPNSVRKRFSRKYEKYISSEYGKNDVLEELENLDEKIFKHWDYTNYNFKFEQDQDVRDSYKLDYGDKVTESVDENNNKSIDSRSKRIKTEQDIIDECKVDLTYWQRDRLITNKWEVGAKNDEGKIVVEPLFQVKLSLVPRKEAIITQRYVESILKRLEDKSPIVPKLRKDTSGEFIYEIGIPDLHFGKLAWDKETGFDYDIDEARKLFLWAIESLLHKVSHVNISKIILPIGNDLFHVDDLNNQTTRGTPVDADTRWQKSFDLGIDMIIEGIELCKKVASVDIIMVQGNHDYQRTYYAGSTLKAWYRNDENVSIDNSPKSRKTVSFGDVFIMYTHGNEEKQNQLPLLMFTEFKESALKKFREIHIGHTHKKRDIHYVYTEEYNGVRVSVLPSLCPPDAWHHKKGFVENIRSAEGRLYHRKRGNEGIFPANVI